MHRLLSVILLVLPTGHLSAANPLFDGWYADPEGIVIEDTVWIFPTYSAPFEEQLHMDAFSSRDLVHWKKHPRIIHNGIIQWARQAMWAPCLVEKDGRYYLFFAANDPQHPKSRWWDPTNTKSLFGGIGIAVADRPGGPYRDYLGEPLISDFPNLAQPIDQFVFEDGGTWYMLYGGWGVCNMVMLNATFTGFRPWPDGATFRDVTPEGYVEGPFILKRRGMYYFMWSEGNWTRDNYRVAYAMSDSPLGPWERQGVILSADPGVATGAGHHSVIREPGTADRYLIVYHRRPIPNTSPHHRVTCIDRLEFNPDGTIRPVQITFEGVSLSPAPAGPAIRP